MNWRCGRGGGRMGLGGDVEGDEENIRSKFGVRCGGDGRVPYPSLGWYGSSIVVSRRDRGLKVDAMVSLGGRRVDGGDKAISAGEGVNSILGMVVCIRGVVGGDGLHPW